MTFKGFFSLFGKSTPEKSDFSAFFREKSKGEQKRILKEVVRKANEDQRAVVEQYRKIHKPTA